jgi:hypothetical protein
MVAEIWHPDAIVHTGPSVVVEDKVYFPCTLNTRIVEYDGGDQINVLDAPLFPYRRIRRTTLLMTAREGVLGFACMAGSELNLWSREATGPALQENGSLVSNTLFAECQIT